jgi:hypothetical protein
VQSAPGSDLQAGRRRWVGEIAAVARARNCEHGATCRSNALLLLSRAHLLLPHLEVLAAPLVFGFHKNISFLGLADIGFMACRQKLKPELMAA